MHSGISPGLLEAIIKHANMEHRLVRYSNSLLQVSVLVMMSCYFLLNLQGNLEGAFSLYEQAIATEKGKGQSETLSMLFVQYSRFFYLVGGNTHQKQVAEISFHLRSPKLIRCL